MNKIIFFLLLCGTLTPAITHAQDTITMLNGEQIRSRVVEISQTELKYKLFDKPESVIRSALKNSIFCVRYESGEKEYFNANGTTTTAPSQPITVNIPVTETSTEDMFAKGQADALLNYSDAGPATATLVTTLVFSGIIGLIPAIACSSTTPSPENLGYPKSDLMKNADYRMGYTSRAKRKKASNVWTHWGIGMGINAAIVIILTTYHK